MLRAVWRALLGAALPNRTHRAGVPTAAVVPACVLVAIASGPPTHAALAALTALAALAALAAAHTPRELPRNVSSGSPQVLLSRDWLRRVPCLQLWTLLLRRGVSKRQGLCVHAELSRSTRVQP